MIKTKKFIVLFGGIFLLIIMSISNIPILNDAFSSLISNLPVIGNITTFIDIFNVYKILGNSPLTIPKVYLLIPHAISLIATIWIFENTSFLDSYDESLDTLLSKILLRTIIYLIIILLLKWSILSVIHLYTKAINEITSFQF
ncbi:hypothetical protein CUB90_19715 [Clostridium sp. CT7]|nr:hypothetical protein CUB90_19715 [Clostridium sp. CT7]